MKGGHDATRAFVLRRRGLLRRRLLLSGLTGGRLQRPPT